MSDGTEFSLGDLSCQCPACSGQVGAGDTIIGAEALGTADLSDQIRTGDSNIDAVIHSNGLKWGSTSFNSGATVSFSFLSSVPSYYSSLVSKYGIDYPSGFSSFSSAQRNATREILDLYSDVANINFVETTGVGTLTFANHSMSGGVGAYAYYPNLQRQFPSDTAPLSGDIWVNTSNTGTSKGSWGYLTLIHEIGHAIGLKHPGNYNAGGGGSDGPYLPSSRDNHQYTVMSYYDHPNYPSTSPVSPMLYDIAAVQYLYGKNNSTRTGNDTYTFSTNTELRAIWDAGGIDTIDASNDSNGATIRLTDGQFSSINGTNNIAIAYDAIIENAIGSNAGDTIYGNTVANTLQGNGGSDRLYGYGGNDTLIGGSGNDYLYGSSGDDTLEGGSGNDYLYGDSGDDTVVFSGNFADYMFDDFGTYFRATDLRSGGDGTDSLYSIEFVSFLNGTFSIDALSGITLNNTSIAENLPAGTLVGTASIVVGAGETLTFSLIDDAGGLFAIDAITGDITTTAPLDFETAATASISVRALGNLGTDISKSFSIAVTDVNEAPIFDTELDGTITGLPAAVEENLETGTVIGTVQGVDQDSGDVLTYSLLGDDTGPFAINSQTGQVSISGALDFETKSSYDLTLQVTDSGGLTDTVTQTISVTDANDAPEVEKVGIVLAEGAIASAALSATDQDGDAFTFSVETNASSGNVTIDNDGNYTYTPADGFLGRDTFSIRVTDENGSSTVTEYSVRAGTEPTSFEPSTDLFFPLEGTGYSSALQPPSSVKVGDDIFVVAWAGTNATQINLQAYYADGTPIGTGTIIDEFEFDARYVTEPTLAEMPNGGALLHWTLSRLDDSGSNVYETLALRLDANGEPIGEQIKLGSNTSSNFPSGGDAVAALSDGSVAVARTEPPSGETISQVSVKVVSSDGATLSEKTFVSDGSFYAFYPAITALADGGFAVSWSQLGLFVQTFNADGSARNDAVKLNSANIGDKSLAPLPDGGFVLTWQMNHSLTQRGVFAQKFAADGTTVGGPIAVSTTGDEAAAPDVAALPDGGFAIFFVRANAAFIQRFGADGSAIGDEVLVDDTGTAYARHVELTLLPNGGLAATWFQNGSDGKLHVAVRLFEAADLLGSEGSVVGSESPEHLFASDDGETMSGHGGEDSLFGGDGADTLIGGSGDDVLDGKSGDDVAVFEGSFAEYDIRSDAGAIVVADQTAGRDGTDTLINVETARFADREVNLTSPDVVLSQPEITENAPTGTEVATASVIFGETAEAFTFTLTDDAGGLLTIDSATGVITTTAPLDHETASTLIFTVHAAGDKGSVVDRTLAVAVTDINEAPEDIDGTMLQVGELAGVGTSVGTVVVDDPDAGDTHTFSLIDDAGGLFAIDPNTGLVTLAGAVNFEETSEHTIRVRAVDSGGLANEWDHTVQVLDQNDPVVAEDVAIILGKNATASGQLAASDEDGDTLTFSRYSGPSSGSVTVNPDGTYIYKPSAGFIGSDSFRYRVSDGNGSDIVRSVDIDVQQSGLIEIATPFTPFADSGDIAIGTTNDIALGAQQTAVLNNGNSVVIWSRQMNNGADYDVFARIIDADGKFVTSEFRVNSYTGNTQAEPTVTALADGSFIVAWASFDSTNLSHTGINAKKFDASGNVIKDEFNLDGTADTSGSDWYVPSTPDISALADGGFALVYQDLALRPTGSHTDVRAVAFDADGNRTTSAEYTHLSKAYDQFSPAVAGLANGKYIAVFLDETNQFGATRLRAKFSTTGGGTGNEFTIASSTSPGIGEPQVAGLAGGGFVVTWYADNVDGDGYGVAAKIYNDDGALVGEQFVPTHTTIDDQFLPDVVATPDGGFVIVYTSFDTVFGDDDVWVQRFDSSGGKIGSAVLVPVSPFEHETLPSVAVGPDGTMTVSWIDVPPGENSGQIMARRYVLPTDVDTIDFPLEGTENGDTIFGPDDGVVIEGHGGDDVIDGGDGIDTVVLSGTAGEYDISADGNDWIIHDTVAGRDGTDRVTNVELVRFGDGTEVTISGEPLVFLSKSSISENGNAGDELGVVKVLGANAGEVFTYSLTDDADSRFAIDASTGVVTATGPLDHEELDVASISVNAVGDQGTVAATSFDIQILDENDAPEAEDSGTTIPEDTVHTGSLIVADQDADDLQFSVTEAPTHGTVSIAEDGTYTYTPDENFFGTDTFTYTVTDGNGGTDTALMTIVVEPVNDAPVADSDTLLTQKDAALTFAITDLLANDSDVEGSALTLVSFGASDNGTIVDNGDGTATFTPADGFFGDTSFQYTIADSGGLESTATVTVTVNDPPVANDDAFATSENAVLEVAVADLLSNDTDADGDTLTVTAVGDAANGTVELVGDTVRFTPTEGFAGDASFTYTISDGRGNLTTGTATVAVSAVDDVLWGDDGGDDALFGGAGSDSLYGQGGADNLRGGIGDDLLEGGSGDDVYSFDLGDGSDLIRDFDGEVTTETYTVNGGYWVSNGETTYWQPTTTTHTRTVSTEIDAGRDAIAFGDGISAGDIALSLDGAGNLTISLLENGGAAALAAGLGEASDDQLVVENWIDSKDRIEELRFADGTVIDISNLAEMVEGTATADSLTGTAGQDWIAAGDGDDTVEGDAGNDIISGGAGADTLTGGAGDDLVLGGDGEDTAVIGGAFADSVVTRQQNGTVIVTGADGTDRLIGVEKIRFDDLEIFADGRNNAPVVANEAAGAVEDGGAITVDVLANDLDADGDTLTVTEAVLRDGAEGSVTINPDGTIGFDPGTGFQDLGAGESVVVTIAYTVSDGAGGETEGTVDVTVTGSNDGPVATSDSLATPEDTALVISAADLIGNDTDADGDALSITGFTQPANGTLSDNGNGTLTFTPGQDFTGETSFTYTVADGNGGTATETVTLTVSNVVDAAQLTVTDAAGAEDGVTPLAIDAQAVSDSDGITGITLSGVPDWATLNKGTENPDGTWSLTPADLDGLAVVPDADASGTFDITVSVTTSDGIDSQVASDTLTVTVAGVADAPVVTATDAAGDEDTAIALDLSAALTDTDGSESLSITVQGVPTGASLSAGTLANGVWTLAAADLAGLTLTPPENFNGEIALTVTATSTEADTGDTATNTTSLTVTVDAVNDAPEAADDTATVIEDGGPVLVDVLANDSDVDGDAMVLTSAEITNGATASIDIVDGKLRVDPGAGFQDLGIGETADIEISYTVEDAAGVPSTAQVIVTVQGRNDGPVAQADAFTTDEDVPLIISAADLLGNDSDIDGDSLSVLSVTQPANGSLSDNGDGTFTFTPNTDFFGQTSFTYTVTDGNGGSATQTATIDIASVVEPASISASDVTGPEDEAIALNLSIDAGNARDPITGIVVTGLPEGALLSAGTKNTDGSWDLTTEQLPGLTVTAPPNSDQAFTLTVAATTTDGIDTSTVSESFTVTPAAVADTPDLSLSNASGLEDNAIALDISAALTDTDGSETLGLRIDGVPAGASLNKGQDLGNGAWALTQADLAGLSLLPAADFNGAIDLTVTATAAEGANGDTSQTVSTLSVTVTPVNDGPETGADFFRTVRGVPITIALSDLTGNDTDVDGDALTVTFVGNAVDGTIVENGDGTVTFTPTEGFFGEAQFDYTISDGNGGTATRTVIVDSSPNDPPVAVDDSFETTEDAAIQIAAADLVANDTDADGDELTVTAVGGALNGTVELIDGIVHFTPEPGFGGQASFTYTVGDGRGDFSTGTATVAVSAVDDVLWGDDGGDDALFGGAGSDSLYGQGGADNLRGGIGDDLLEGGSGDDVYSFDLGDGSDLIRDFDGEVTTETYTVNGGYWVSNGETTYWQPTTTTHTRTVSTEIDAGRDAIAFGDGISAGNIALSLDGAGNLTISLLESGGASALAAGLGEASDDQLVVENWIDSKDRIEELRFADGTVIDISNLAEMVEGTATADSLSGTAGQDWIAAGDGDDTVEGDAGNDIISGGAGADTLIGGAGDDLVLGGDGEDTAVIGGAFADSVVTRQQNGTVIVTGADGTDRLIGVEKIRFDDLEIFADGRNNAPVVANETAGAVEDGGAITVDVLANDLDADGDTLTVTEAVLRDGAEGSVTINPDGTIGFDPGTGFQDLGAGESVVVTIAYTVSDGAGGETEGTVDVTVTGSNDGPVATSDSLATAEDTALVISAADLIGNDTDADGDALSITGFTQPANGTLSDNGNGTLTFTPGQDFTGETSFTYTVADGNGGTATETVTLTVSNVVDAAQLTVTDAAGTEDGVTPLAIDAQAVSDSDGITGITLSGVPDWATLNKGTENPDGTWSLTPADLDGLAVVPDADASGTFDITVSVTTSDGIDSQVASDTLTVTVAGVADAPVVTATDAAGDEDTAIALDLSAALTDTDGSESLSITVQGVPTGASLSAGTLANGVWTLAAADLAGLTLTPPENFNGEIALTVTATSTEADTGDTATNTTSLTVTVDAVNDAPEAVDGLSFRTVQGAPITIAGATLLDGATDADGDAVSIQSVGNAENGTVILNGDGSVTFTPDAGYFGPARFDITVTDGNGGTDVATVDIDSVDNEAPVTGADSFATQENAPILLSAAQLLQNDTDTDGDTITLTGVGDAVNGTVALVDGAVQFTPVDGFAGEASFTYTVSDGHGNSSVGTATVTVAAVDDVLWGDDGGDDALFGGAGSDSLYGQDGADTLRGGIGDDLLEGGGGDDVYTFDLGDGSDLIRDFDGEVTTETYTVNGGYWVTNGETTYWQPTTTTHTRTVNNEVDAGQDAIAFGDGITAEDVTLTLVGNNLVIALSGAGAASALGADAASADQITVENWTDEKDRVEELRFADGTVIDISNLAGMIAGTVNADELVGTSGMDWISGGGGNDALRGDAGDDVLLGGDGNDWLNGGAGADLLIGGNGNDNYQGFDSTDTIVENAGGGTDTLWVTSDYTLTDSNIENLRIAGSPEFDFFEGFTLTGNGAANVINGTVFDDILRGEAGDDTLYGEGGDDIFYGGEGNDHLEAQFVSPYLSSRNQLFGEGGDDTLIGDDTSDILDGGTGSDAMSGGGSDDIYFVDNVGDTIDEGVHFYGTAEHSTAAANLDLGEDLGLNASSVVVVLVPEAGRDTVFTSVSYDFTGTNIENIFATGTAGLTLTGTYDANIIEGTIGADTIFGADGDDIIYGGDGDDDLTGGLGDNEVYGGAGNDSLHAEEEAWSTLAGGTGDDTYYLAGNHALVQENIGEGFDTVISSGDYSADENIERIIGTGNSKLILTGAENTVEIIGNDAGNSIDSYSTKNQILAGGAGNDIISSHSGDDLISGGAGTYDIVAGGLGNDTYLFNPGDGFDELWDSGGFDTIEFGEGISFGDVQIGSSSGNRPVLSFANLISSDSIELMSSDADGFYGIETLAFADGSTADISGLTIADLPETGTVALTDLVTVTPGSVVAETAGDDGETGLDLFSSDAIPMESWSADDEQSAAGDGVELGDMPGEIDYEALFNISGTQSTIVQAPGESAGDATVSAEVASQMNNLVAAMNTFSGSGSADPGEALAPEETAPTLLTPLWETPSS